MCQPRAQEPHALFFFFFFLALSSFELGLSRFASSRLAPPRAPLIKRCAASLLTCSSMRHAGEMRGQQGLETKQARLTDFHSRVFAGNVSSLTGQAN